MSKSSRSMTKEKFINQWLRHFAPNLSKKQFEQYVKDQFIWHVFSWKLLDFEGLLEGDEARTAFDQANKTQCICCDLFGIHGVTDTLLPEFDTAVKIDAKFVEFYVVAKDYSWTYIKTHECDHCGPYFLNHRKI